MTGQINLDTAFGRAIVEIASDPHYTTFCEVGTWNGMGSTRCIYEGIKGRDAFLYSIEGDREMAIRAKEVWKNTPRVKVEWGSLHRNVMSNDAVRHHPLFYRISDHYQLHYAAEVRSTVFSPIVTPPPCDVILLDGGEFSTEGDWAALAHKNLRIVMLDDTQVIKTNQIYNSLLKSPEWKCLYDQPHDRNGWAIFARSEESV